MSAVRASRLAVLGNRDFSLYLVARLLGTLAVQMQTVAVGWQVYEVTRNPLDLGLIGLSQFLPFVLSILPAGHLADSRDRRRIVMACYALECACALLLFAIALHGFDDARPVFAVMIVFGITRAFQMPTGQALLPNLVPTEQFGAAVAINSLTWQIATIAGPALGGIVYLAGAPVVYATAAALFAIAVVLTLGLRAGGRGGPAEAASLATLFLGLKFVRSHRVVLGAISLDLFAVLFGGATALLPVYAADVLHVGPDGLGWLRTASGIGAAVCGIYLSLTAITRRVGAHMFGGVVVFGVATIVFGLSTSFWLSMLALFAMGAGDMVSIYIRHLLVQLETPDAIRGRVSAVNAVFITVPAVIVGGCATLVVAALWTRLFPELSGMDRLPTPALDDEHAARVNRSRA